jgi:hypothetical protein
MKNKPIKCAVLSGLLLGAAGIMTAQAANSTMITFSVDMDVPITLGSFTPGSSSVYVNGDFYGWSYPGLQLFQVGSTTVYTNTFNDTTDANGGVANYRFNTNNPNGSYESTASWDNRAAILPSTYGASLVLPTPYYGDDGGQNEGDQIVFGQVNNVTFQVDMAEEILLGHFNPATDKVDVRGSFNGWSANTSYLSPDPSIRVTNAGGIITTNVYTGTFAITTGAEVGGAPLTNAFMEWKVGEDLANGNTPWDSPWIYVNDAGNRFWADNTNQVLPKVFFSDAPYSLAYVTLNVDMTGVIDYDPYYEPNSVTVWGTFNNWSSGPQLTNNPAAGNPNLFSGTVVMPQGVPIIYQVRYTNSMVGGWVYDYADDGVYNNALRRTLTLPITSGALYTNVPAFYFLDLAPDDYLPQATTVLFTVDMTGAVQTNGIAFNADSDDVYINGTFANGGSVYYPQTWYPWAGTVNPVGAPPGFQMIRVGSTKIYTNAIVIPAGMPVGLAYQYGVDPSGTYGGPVEGEAPSGANHYRVVRTTALGTYAFPTDTFTNQPYAEPVFAPGNLYQASGTLSGGNLTTGTAVNGKVPVSWLGRPGAHLQVKSSLASGAWLDIPATDGVTWTSGVNTTNGLMSVTNWPASGSAFFRLVKP